MRPAEWADSDALLAWRNDPDTRGGSRHTAVVGRSEHESWLRGVLEDETRHLLVVEADGRPAGQVRFDRVEPAVYEISVTIAPEARGRGLAADAIQAGLRWLRERQPGAEVLAHVRPRNERSARAFAASGFEPTGETDDAGFDRLRSRPAATG